MILSRDRIIVSRRVRERDNIVTVAKALPRFRIRAVTEFVGTSNSCIPLETSRRVS